MKYILLSVVFLSIFGCGWLKKQPKTPEEVTVIFYRALCSFNFDEAALYCDSSTQQLMNTMNSLSSMMPIQQREKNIEKAKLIQTATCSINGDIATCQLCCDENGVNISETVTLRLQQNGRWLVFMNKENRVVGE